MPLKSVINEEAFNALDEALKPIYKKRQDGAYELDADVEDHSAVRGLKSAFDREKDERKKAREQRKHLLEKLGIEDDDEADAKIEEYLALRKKADEDRGKKLLDEGKVEELLAERTGAMKRDYEKRLKAAEERANSLQSVAERALVDNAISVAANQAGVRKTALTDVMLRGKQVFKLKDDSVVAMDGEKPRFSRDGQSPLTINEWLEGLREEAPHLYEPSNGGGAAGGGRQTTDSFVLTREQARDPAKYRAVKEAAAKAGKDVVIQ